MRIIVFIKLRKNQVNILAPAPEQSRCLWPTATAVTYITATPERILLLARNGRDVTASVGSETAKNL